MGLIRGQESSNAEPALILGIMRSYGIDLLRIYTMIEDISGRKDMRRRQPVLYVSMRVPVYLVPLEQMQITVIILVNAHGCFYIHFATFKS